MNKLNDHTFIVPDNDGESRKIIELCQSYDLFLKVSGQKWGATLDREPDSTFSDLKPVVVTVEIPGLKKEKELKEAGFKLAIVDHHIYKINGDVKEYLHRDDGHRENIIYSRSSSIQVREHTRPYRLFKGT